MVHSGWVKMADVEYPQPPAPANSQPPVKKENKKGHEKTCMNF